mgnify:CR=1 FL=1|tara:strand:- start:5056 stop:5898 length:843 start_codon:yes stop_codon:yes gene_type:complete
MASITPMTSMASTQDLSTMSYVDLKKKASDMGLLHGLSRKKKDIIKRIQIAINHSSTESNEIHVLDVDTHHDALENGIDDQDDKTDDQKAELDQPESQPVSQPHHQDAHLQSDQPDPQPVSQPHHQDAHLQSEPQSQPVSQPELESQTAHQDNMNDDQNNNRNNKKHNAEDKTEDNSTKNKKENVKDEMIDKICTEVLCDLVQASIESMNPAINHSETEQSSYQYIKLFNVNTIKLTKNNKKVIIRNVYQDRYLNILYECSDCMTPLSRKYIVLRHSDFA